MRNNPGMWHMPATAELAERLERFVAWPPDLPAGEMERLKGAFAQIGNGHCGPDELQRTQDFFSDPAYRKLTRDNLERRRLAGTVLDPKAGRRLDLLKKAARIMREVEITQSAWYGERRVYKYRVSLCHSAVNGFTQTGGIEVYSSPDALRAEYRGLQTCGSVWHCPVCSPKIARERVGEINQAMQLWQNGHKGERGVILFATFTYQHDRAKAGRGMLAEQLRLFREALGELKRNGTYRRLLDDAGYKGSIRGLETTYGELNGWHNHTHEIVFAGEGATIRAFRSVRKLWARTLIEKGLAGLGEFDEPRDRRKKLRDLLVRCYVIQHGQYACDYVAKFGKEPEGHRGRWGFASEIARSHLKGGKASSGTNAEAAGELPRRCDHATPWELLNDAEDGDQMSADLYREFGEAFHGKRQIFWSKGLRAFFDIDIQEDDELAAKADQRCTQFVGVITRDQWRAVLAANARWAVLCIAARQGREFMVEYLERLENRTQLAVEQEDTS